MFCLLLYLLYRFYKKYPTQSTRKEWGILPQSKNMLSLFYASNICRYPVNRTYRTLEHGLGKYSDHATIANGAPLE